MDKFVLNPRLTAELDSAFVRNNLSAADAKFLSQGDNLVKAIAAIKDGYDPRFKPMIRREVTTTELMFGDFFTGRDEIVMSRAFEDRLRRTIGVSDFYSGGHQDFVHSADLLKDAHLNEIAESLRAPDGDSYGSSYGGYHASIGLFASLIKIQWAGESGPLLTDGNLNVRWTNDLFMCISVRWYRSRWCCDLVTLGEGENLLLKSGSRLFF